MIGEKIKELREKNNMTQTMLAKELGLSRSAINAWEMCISIPSTQYIIELSKLFNISSDYILGLNNNKEEIDIGFLNSEEKEIIYSLLNTLKKYHNEE